MASPKSSGRMIRKSVSESKKIPTLSPEATVLFFMLIPHYTSHGKMAAGPGTIKDEIVPFISYFNYENLPTYLQEISDKTNVKWFQHNGKWYLHSLNFLEEHQDLREDKLGRDLLPDFPKSWSSPGVVPDLPSRGSLKEEEKQERQEQPALTKELITPAAPPPAPAVVEAGKPAHLSSPDSVQSLEDTRSEVQIRAVINQQQRRETLQRLFPWVEIDILAEKICAKYRGEPVLDPWSLVLECAKKEPKPRGSAAELDAVLRVNGEAVREFAARDPDRLRFAGVIAWLAEKYERGGKPRVLTVRFLLDYRDALADVDLDDLEEAARRHYRRPDKEGKYFPQAPGTLLESVRAVIAEKARRSIEASAAVPAQPVDPEAHRRMFAETVEGFRRIGMDVSGWELREREDGSVEWITGDRGG